MMRQIGRFPRHSLAFGARKLAALGCTALLLAGCDALFPEFAGKAPAAMSDAAPATGDAGSTPAISGTVCVLQNLGDYRSCVQGVPAGMHVTVEETRDSAAVDNAGNFTLPLSKTLAVATLAAVDATNTFLPTVVTFALASGRADKVAVPLVAVTAAQQLALANGLSLDDKRGLVFGYPIDRAGAPVLAHVQPVRGADGPIADGGLVALFNLTPPLATLTIGAAQFPVAVRSGALTFSLLQLAN